MQILNLLVLILMHIMTDVQEVVYTNLGFHVLLPHQQLEQSAQKFAEMEDDTGHQQQVILAMTGTQFQETDAVVLVKYKLDFNANREESKIETFVMKSAVLDQETTGTILVMMGTTSTEMDVQVTAS